MIVSILTITLLVVLIVLGVLHIMQAWQIYKVRRREAVNAKIFAAKLERRGTTATRNQKVIARKK